MSMLRHITHEQRDLMVLWPLLQGFQRNLKTPVRMPTGARA